MVMTGKRNYKQRAAFGKRGSYKPRKTAPTRTAPQGIVKGVVRSGFSGSEIKNWDLELVGQAMAANSPFGLDLMAGIAEGTTQATRVGQKILVKSLDVQYNIYGVIGSAVVQETAAGNQFADIIVVWDKQPNGAQATAADVFVDDDTNLTNGLPANVDRFVVLRREKFAFSRTGPSAFTGSWHIPMEMVTRYVDATDSPQTNNLLLFGLTTAPAAGVNNTSIIMSSFTRVKFVDP